MTPPRWAPAVSGALVFALAVSTRAPDALAQGGSEAAAAAEALFTTARKLLDEKRYDEACPKFEESQRLDPGVGTLMYLALCYEQSGKDASAWSTYRAAQSAATQAGQSERARIARQRADELEPRLARIVVQAAAKPPQGLKVTRDGLVLGQALFGTPVPVDPGKHVLNATAPGRQTFTTEITVTSGETVTVEVGPLKPARNSAPEMRPASGTADLEGRTTLPELGETRNPPAQDRANHSTTQRWLGVGTGLVGLVGLGIGCGFALHSASLSDQAEQYRRPGTNIYDEPGYSYNGRALDARNAALISSAIGAAAFLGGIAIYLTAPAAGARSARRTQATTALVLAPYGFSVGTRWD